MSALPLGDSLAKYVLLADDYPQIREWLKFVLESSGFVVDAEAANGREAVFMTRRYQPDLVIMDLQMPELNGLKAAQMILGSFPATHVIMLTTYASEPAVREGLRIGIRGFVAKNGRSQAVLEAIASVLDGKTYIGPEFDRIAREKPTDP